MSHSLNFIYRKHLQVQKMSVFTTCNSADVADVYHVYFFPFPCMEPRQQKHCTICRNLDMFESFLNLLCVLFVSVSLQDAEITDVWGLNYLAVLVAEHSLCLLLDIWTRDIRDDIILYTCMKPLEQLKRSLTWVMANPRQTL